MHRLLEQFMNGETTLDEERYLSEWLRAHEVNEALQPYKRMFAYFDRGMTSESAAPSAPRRTLRRQWWHPAVAAASLAILVCICIKMTSPLPGDKWPTASVPTTGADTIAFADTMMVTSPMAQTDVHAARQHHAEPRHQQHAERSPADKREVRLSKKRDSIEVQHTEASLELANSEFIAEQIELQQQLSQLRMQSQLRTRQRQVNVSLPCQ